ILETKASCRFATQIAPAAAVMASGSLPTGTVRDRPLSPSSMTSPVAGATAQPWSTATVRAVTPTAPGSVRSTRPRAGLISETVPSAAFATHTFCRPYAKPLGPFPTLTVWTTWFTEGLICETVPSAPFATHTKPGLTATPAGEPPTEIVCCGVRVDGSMRVTELSSVLATQIAPSPAATPFGAEPTGTAPAMEPVFVSMTPTSFGATALALAVPPPRERNVPSAAATATATITTPATSRLLETRPERP